jgi:peptidoglycan/xylan/chitin deacetylase (PgdA/CDA1 family)
MKVSNMIEKKYKSLIICHQDDLSNWELLSSWLNNFSDLVGIVFLQDSFKDKFKHLKYELKRSGIIGILDVIMMRSFYRVFLASKDKLKIKKLIAERIKQYPAFDPKKIKNISVGSPNSPAAIFFIKECAPDFILAKCKTILKPKVFELAPLGAYVAHPGICPEYRNSHGCFWAMANNDTDKIGFTLLKIDRGIDTGSMLLQGTTNFDLIKDSYIYIQNKVVLDNLELIKLALLSFFNQKLQIINPAGRKSMIWGQPRLSSYLRIYHKILEQKKYTSLALLYHDVSNDTWPNKKTGRQAPGSRLYKISEQLFSQHLKVIKEDDFLVTNIFKINSGMNNKLLLCFDDGGISNFNIIAPALDKYSWPGHFFVITNQIDQPGFMTRAQIKDLKNRNHVIGSHSHSHPNLTVLNDQQIQNEFIKSKKIIEEIIGENCQCLSVPEGELNHNIIKIAKKVGYKYIFTSTPEIIDTTDLSEIGRWAIKSTTTPKELIKIIHQDFVYIVVKKIRWTLIRFFVKIDKGGLFFKIRNYLLSKNNGL